MWTPLTNGYVKFYFSQVNTEIDMGELFDSSFHIQP